MNILKTMENDMDALLSNLKGEKEVEGLSGLENDLAQKEAEQSQHPQQQDFIPEIDEERAELIRQSNWEI